jgi:hypothetical protein
VICRLLLYHKGRNAAEPQPKEKEETHRRDTEYAKFYIFKLPLRALCASVVNYPSPSYSGE